VRSAAAFKRNDGWYFHSNSQTTMGLWIANAPFIKRALDEGDSVLGQTILEMLQASQLLVPHPAKWDASYGILDLAGVKSWAAFMRGASYVGVRGEDEWLMLEPSTNAGAKKGFVPISGVSLQIPADSRSDRIGETLKEAIALCAP
jgi:hypothetical protein